MIPYLLRVAALYVDVRTASSALSRQSMAAAAVEPDGASRPGEPPVGSDRRPGAPQHQHAEHRADQRVTPTEAGGRGGWVNESSTGRSGFPPAYLDRVGSSFTDFLASTAPDLLPGRRPVPQIPVGDIAPHGTTIVAVTFDGGVLMGGDRRATMGNLISSRDIEKVYPADSYSVIGIAGAAGIAIEMVKLYQVELEHYEKIEGITLSLDGKANRLAADDPRQPRRRHAGPRRRPAVRRLRPRRRRRTRRRAASSATTSPAGTTRSAATPPSAPARCSPRTR